jgi:glycosyltransferase involved in cell wall biosynthesis
MHDARPTDTAVRQTLREGGPPVTIVFLVTEDWYFWSHRLAIARAARDAGARVIIATRVDALRSAIEAEGFAIVSLPWRRRSHNFFNEVRALLAIVRAYRRTRPDIVHHVAIKPVVYGGIAARIARTRTRVNAIAGFGYVETSRTLRARILRAVFRGALRFAWQGPDVHAIVQNPDDRDALAGTGLLDAANIHMIRGSGVDVTRFVPSPEPVSARVRVVYAGRLLWSKGMRELAQAARELRAHNAPVDVVLVGNPDPENPESVPERDVEAWVREGIVVRHPWTDDMASVWRDAHIAVLPSYREGLPRALLEAAASSRAIVATDAPGCREIARDGVNALCVPPRDARALANAIERLARDTALRARFGAAGRELVVREYSEARVVEETLGLYRRVCAPRAARA